MTVIIGIDAAWTSKQPSGVAAVQRIDSKWTLVAVTPSYSAFAALASSGTSAPTPVGGTPDVPELLAAARALTGYAPELVAIDMPLSRSQIVGRRTADDAVSRAYGSRKCATHTPSAERPGAISDRLTADFAAAGYSLRTSAPFAPALIEVYPHPALTELARSAERLPYKVSKIRAYWPNATPVERRRLLLAQWGLILELLSAELVGVRAKLSRPDVDAPGKALKAFEDMLDAVVCAWVGACAMSGRATAYGDEDAAIWIPRP